MQPVIYDQIGAVQFRDIRPGQSIQVRIDAFSHQGCYPGTVSGDNGQGLTDLGDSGDDGFLCRSRYGSENR